MTTIILPFEEPLIPHNPKDMTREELIATLAQAESLSRKSIETVADTVMAYAKLEAEAARLQERADNNGHSAAGWRSRWETDLPPALARAEAAERQLAEAHEEIEKLKEKNADQYAALKKKWEGDWRAHNPDDAKAHDIIRRAAALLQSDRGRAEEAERQLEAARAALKRIARGAELQAHVMRDPLRTGGWEGAERVADAFDDIAERARAALAQTGKPQP